MIIDTVIQAAIHDAYLTNGSNWRELERQSGVHSSMWAKWESGKTKKADEKSWEKAYPVIEKFMPNDPEYWPRAKARQYASSILPNHSHPCDAPDRPRELRELCAQWDDIPPEARAGVLFAVRSALAIAAITERAKVAG